MIQRMLKKFALGVCISAVCLSAFPDARAANTADLPPIWAVTVEGKYVYFVNPNNQCIEPLFYQDMLYIPVRTAGEWAGKNVVWDAASNTIDLTGNAEKKYYTGSDVADYAIFPYPSRTELPVVERPDVTIQLDGQTQTYLDSDGNSRYPIFYGGTAYVLLRQAAELIDMDVDWYQKQSDNGTKMTVVSIYTPLTDEQKDAYRAYLDQIRERIDTYGETAASLMEQKNDGADVWKETLDKLERQLDEMLAVEVPQASGVSSSLWDELKRQIGIQRENIQRVYRVIDTQTAEELFRVENGNMGALMTIVLEPIPENTLDSIADRLNLN